MADGDGDDGMQRMGSLMSPSEVYAMFQQHDSDDYRYAPVDAAPAGPLDDDGSGEGAAHMAGDASRPATTIPAPVQEQLDQASRWEAVVHYPTDQDTGPAAVEEALLGQGEVADEHHYSNPPAPDRSPPDHHSCCNKQGASGGDEEAAAEDDDEQKFQEVQSQPQHGEHLALLAAAASAPPTTQPHLRSNAAGATASYEHGSHPSRFELAPAGDGEVGDSDGGVAAGEDTRMTEADQEAALALTALSSESPPPSPQMALVPGSVGPAPDNVAEAGQAPVASPAGPAELTAAGSRSPSPARAAPITMEAVTVTPTAPEAVEPTVPAPQQQQQQQQQPAYVPPLMTPTATHEPAHVHATVPVSSEHQQQQQRGSRHQHRTSSRQKQPSPRSQRQQTEGPGPSHPGASPGLPSAGTEGAGAGPMGMPFAFYLGPSGFPGMPLALNPMNFMGMPGIMTPAGLVPAPGLMPPQPGMMSMSPQAAGMMSMSALGAMGGMGGMGAMRGMASVSPTSSLMAAMAAAASQQAGASGSVPATPSSGGVVMPTASAPGARATDSFGQPGLEGGATGAGGEESTGFITPRDVKSPTVKGAAAAAAPPTSPGAARPPRPRQPTPRKRSTSSGSKQQQQQQQETRSTSNRSGPGGAGAPRTVLPGLDLRDTPSPVSSWPLAPAAAPAATGTGEDQKGPLGLHLHGIGDDGGGGGSGGEDNMVQRGSGNGNIPTSRRRRPPSPDTVVLRYKVESPTAPPAVAAPTAPAPAPPPQAAPAGRSSRGQGLAGPVDMAPKELAWLEVLTSTDNFFKPCPRCSNQHAGRDAQATILDLDDPSPEGLCQHCKVTALNAGHRILQVRRSTYHDVVKVCDVVNLLDLSGIQQYMINNSRVVFLRPRPQPRPPKGVTMPARCVLDGRQLMDAGSRYCCLRCKMDVERYGVQPVFDSSTGVTGAHSHAPRAATSPRPHPTHTTTLSPAPTTSQDHTGDGSPPARVRHPKRATSTRPASQPSSEGELQPVYATPLDSVPRGPRGKHMVLKDEGGSLAELGPAGVERMGAASGGAEGQEGAVQGQAGLGEPMTSLDLAELLLATSAGVKPTALASQPHRHRHQQEEPHQHTVLAARQPVPRSKHGATDQQQVMVQLEGLAVPSAAPSHLTPHTPVPAPEPVVPTWPRALKRSRYSAPTGSGSAGAAGNASDGGTAAAAIGAGTGTGAGAGVGAPSSGAVALGAAVVPVGPSTSRLTAGSLGSYEQEGPVLVLPRDVPHPLASFRQRSSSNLNPNRGAAANGVLNGARVGAGVGSNGGISDRLGSGAEAPPGNHNGASHKLELGTNTAGAPPTSATVGQGPGINRHQPSPPPQQRTATNGSKPPQQGQAQSADRRIGYPPTVPSALDEGPAGEGLDTVGALGTGIVALRQKHQQEAAAAAAAAARRDSAAAEAPAGPVASEEGDEVDENDVAMDEDSAGGGAADAARPPGMHTNNINNTHRRPAGGAADSSEPDSDQGQGGPGQEDMNEGPAHSQGLPVARGVPGLGFAGTAAAVRQHGPAMALSDDTASLQDDGEPEGDVGGLEQGAASAVPAGMMRNATPAMSPPTPSQSTSADTHTHSYSSLKRKAVPVRRAPAE